MFPNKFLLITLIVGIICYAEVAFGKKDASKNYAPPKINLEKISAPLNTQVIPLEGDSSLYYKIQEEPILIERTVASDNKIEQGTEAKQNKEDKKRTPSSKIPEPQKIEYWKFSIEE